MTGGLLSESFASVSADNVCVSACEQNVMIQIAPLGLHKTSWAHVMCVSGQARGTKGDQFMLIPDTASSSRARPPRPRQGAFITHVRTAIAN